MRWADDEFAAAPAEVLEHQKRGCHSSQPPRRDAAQREFQPFGPSRPGLRQAGERRVGHHDFQRVAQVTQSGADLLRDARADGERYDAIPVKGSTVAAQDPGGIGRPQICVVGVRLQTVRHNLK